MTERDGAPPDMRNIARAGSADGCGSLFRGMVSVMSSSGFLLLKSMLARS